MELAGHSLSTTELTALGTSAGAIFAAVAAAAAWRAAAVTAREARARSQPFVTVGILRYDYDKHAIIVPLKNLGQGPAINISMEVCDEVGVISSRLAPGLAPMEAADWTMYVLDPHSETPPTLPPLDKLRLVGAADDAAGRRHPLHMFGMKGGKLPGPHGWRWSRLHRWFKLRAK